MTETQNNSGAGDVKPEISKKEGQIVKQIEYYFGDINLPRDRFLMSEVKKGWVPMDVMLKFNRLAKITTDVDEITDALAKHSSLMEVNENRNAIRRRVEKPLPENTLEYWADVKKRTVYVKGFPQEEKIDDLLEFFQRETKGDIVNLLMRKTKVGEPRVFKGSVFITFTTEAKAREFVEDKKPFEYGCHTLAKMMQEDYWAEKHKETKEKKASQKALKDSKKAQVGKDQLESLSAAHYVKGIVLKVSGLPPTVSIPTVREFFGPFESVAYVKLDNERHEGLIRFDTREENGAQKAWDKACAAGENGKVVMTADDKPYELEAQPLTGDEESAYWIEFNNKKLSMNNNDKKGKRGGKGQRNSKENKPSRKRANSADEDGVPKKNKRIVFDDNGNPVSSSEEQDAKKEEGTTDAE